MSGLIGAPTYTAAAMNRIAFLGQRKADPVVRNAWDYYDSTSYGINSYMRPGTLLVTMENYLGAPVMARIMRTWFERYHYHHPTTLDFRNVVNEVSGKDMNWYFDQFVFGTDVLDYKVASVECNRVSRHAEPRAVPGERETRRGHRRRRAAHPARER